MKPLVGGKEKTAQRFCKRQIRRVVGREVVARADYAREDVQVAMARERQVEVVLESFAGALLVEPLFEECASDDSGDLEIAQGGHMDVGIGSLEKFPDGETRLAAKQVFGESGSVDDEDTQSSSRPARSSRMT